ncbi:MAG TPA: DUF1476 domain-containing protein [Telmatospirillum sp.]|nr:DUF1476 domain-containing protein [Telmatospirillum sp.]
MKDYPKNSLDEREKAFEAKYQLDEAVAFKVNVRQAKLLGLWVAERLGLTGEAATAYGRAAVEADLLKPGHVALMGKLRDDLSAGGRGADADRLSHELFRWEAVARDQVIAELTASKG